MVFNVIKYNHLSVCKCVFSNPQTEMVFEMYSQERKLSSYTEKQRLCELLYNESIKTRIMKHHDQQRTLVVWYSLYHICIRLLPSPSCILQAASSDMYNTQKSNKPIISKKKYKISHPPWQFLDYLQELCFCTGGVNYQFPKKHNIQVPKSSSKLAKSIRVQQVLGVSYWQHLQCR